MAALRDRLLHITARNPSIVLGTLPAKRGVDVAVASDDAARWIGRIMMGRPACIATDRDGSDESADARTRCTALRRALQHQRDETGQESGHVGFPFLTGSLDDDTWIRGPLLLMPVDVEHRPGARPGGWYATPRDGARPQLNKALLAAVAKRRGIQLDDALADAVDDLLEHAGGSEGMDVGQLMADLEDLLRQHGIPAPLLDGDFVPLQPVDRKQEPLHIARHVIVGDFPQANEPIHADYDALMRAAPDDLELVASLLDTTARDLPDVQVPAIDDVPDNDIGNVLPANGSQTDVLLQARERQCTVVRGPPGTGKSQVITNLVTDALRHGQRVLVVCQKRAALDVVHERLRQAGLDDVALLVHDANGDRKDAFARLSRLIDGPTPGVPDLRPICDEVDRLVDDLDGAVAVFGRDHRGLSIHAIHAEADPAFTPILRGHVALRNVQWSDLLAAESAIAMIGDDVRRYSIRHAWKDRRDLSSAPSRADVEARLQTLHQAVSAPREAAPRSHLESLDSAFTIWKGTRGPLRWLDADWREAKRQVTAFVADRDASVDWHGRIRQGLRVWDAIDALDDVLGPRMVEAMLAPDAPDKVESWLAALDDWQMLVQTDRALAEIPAKARGMLRLALRRLGRDAASRLRQEVLHTWIAELEETEPLLRGDLFHAHARKRDRLESILGERRRQMADGIGTAMRELARTPVGGETSWNQAGALLRRKRRIPTLRRLIHDPRLGHVWDRAARCWLMSPEAVSAVHPMEAGLFDVVVFDEASQLAVERALPAVFRAKRVVIAGDEQQLPPFDLFSGHDEDVDDELETDSLLSLATAAVGASMLEWHYRSEHQELVEFSNQAYYGGGLKVVPNPDAGARPIRYHRVDGRFVGRRNGIEAEAVIDVVAELLARPEPPSIGIVTFNQAQRDLLEDRIDLRCDQDASFAADWSAAMDRGLDARPFIKNIENVQGDERDVIVFSTTYGPDAQGRVNTRFGVFNRQGGEHRLNVAITRARLQIHVVTSLDPEQLDVDGAAHAGPKHLRAYLQYARAVDAADAEDVQRVLDRVRSGDASRHDGATASALHARIVRALDDEGLVARPLVGFSGYRIDVAVADRDDPDRALVAVELDGPNYRAARGARERDVQRQQFLESRGWSVVRVWSRNWFLDEDKQVRRIVGAVERAKLRTCSEH